VPYILDTNTLGDLWRYGQEQYLGRKLATVPDPRSNLRVTIITFEEMLGGRLLDLRRDPKKVPNLLPLHSRYQLLTETYERLANYYPPLPFDEDAQAVYENIPHAVRTNTLKGDCKIASIAVQKDYTVITANTQDFVRIATAIPVKFEDWTIEPLH
jgi:predicted nucleic acid-binding protein